MIPAPAPQVRPAPERELRIPLPTAKRSSASNEAKSGAPSREVEQAQAAPAAAAPRAQSAVPKPWNPRVFAGAAGRVVQIGAFGSVHPGQARLVVHGSRVSGRGSSSRRGLGRRAIRRAAPSIASRSARRRRPIPKCCASGWSISLQLRGRRIAVEGEGRAVSDEPDLRRAAAVARAGRGRGRAARPFGAARCSRHSRVVLLAALIVAATFFWLGRRDSIVNGPPQLIKAPPGPYKIKPPNPGGLDISGRERDGVRNQRRRGQGFAARPQQAAGNAGRQAGEGSSPRRLRRPMPRRRLQRRSPHLSPRRPAATAASSSSAPSRTRRRPSAPGRPCRRASPALPRLSKLIVPFSGGIRLARRRRVAGGREAGLPDAEGCRRKLLRRAMNAGGNLRPRRASR